MLNQVFRRRLDQLIELQFKQLTPVEQRILRSASVAGERFSVWAITTAAELEPGSHRRRLRKTGGEIAIHQGRGNSRVGERADFYTL